MNIVRLSVLFLHICAFLHLGRYIYQGGFLSYQIETSRVLVEAGRTPTLSLDVVTNNVGHRRPSVAHQLVR